MKYHDIRKEPRPLGVMLARLAAPLPPDHPGLALLNKLYADSQPSDQLQCRTEMLEIRAAIRGERLAEIVEPVRNIAGGAA